MQGVRRSDSVVLSVRGTPPELVHGFIGLGQSYQGQFFFFTFFF
jgi:hypothetical protein